MTPPKRSRPASSNAVSRTPLNAKWFQILLALADADRHGLEIVREVERSTEGAMRLWPGALYGALEELAANGWIREVEPPADAQRGGNPRYYRITASGRQVLAAEVARLERLLHEARTKIASPPSR
ncbi:MAG TPA: helix-turn-helix transcriptional regulator [Thermoanaerobaculia bacterium]|nr:helix-turn-helix transcriptional regulator [Thermoanaerobaculia bacterium]